MLLRGYVPDINEILLLLKIETDFMITVGSARFQFRLASSFDYEEAGMINLAISRKTLQKTKVHRSVLVAEKALPGCVNRARETRNNEQNPREVTLLAIEGLCDTTWAIKDLRKA